MYLYSFNMELTTAKGIFRLLFQTPYFVFDTDKMRCIVSLFFSVGTSLFYFPTFGFIKYPYNSRKVIIIGLYATKTSYSYIRIIIKC